MTDQYSKFVAGKLSRTPPTGIVAPYTAPAYLAEFQGVLVRWALRRGRSALFADTGLGKTRMEIEWARVVAAYTGKPVLILTPLAVAAQTVAEGAKIGVVVTICREAADVRPGVNVANYERLHKFDASTFGGVVLDESSCIKHHDTRTLKVLMDAFAGCAFKLCATATPSPNDYTELGTHAEFLGVCSRTEMLSEYFCHDGGETSTWRLKGHARGLFWRFVASWGAMIRRPSDLGYSDDGYVLPPLVVEHHVIPAEKDEAEKAGLLFVREASTLSERRAARRASMGGRVKACLDRVALDGSVWVVWCDLNAESEALAEGIAGAVEVCGSDSIEEKERRLRAFGEGAARVIVSKPSICGWGLNWQHANHMAFVGVTDSWEAYYQAVRRCYRFGQTKPVHIHIFTSELDGAVAANLKRKEADAQRMAEELSSETRAAVRDEVLGQKRITNDYAPRKRMEVPSWLRA